MWPELASCFAMVRIAMELFTTESGRVQRVTQVSGRGQKRTAVDVSAVFGKKGKVQK